ERSGSVHVQHVRRLPHHPRHQRAGHSGTRPHAPGGPGHPGLRHHRQRAVRPRPVDHRSPGREARCDHASHPALAIRPGRPGGLPPVAHVGTPMATVTTQPLEALEQSWFEPPGLVSWFTTVDHKRIGMKYLVTARAPDAGWFAYTPLSDARFTPGINIDFYALGLIFTAISSTGGAINFIVTIFKMRAPGMSINRIPIFVWGELAMSLAIVFALPPLTVACTLLELQRRFGFRFFDSGEGGDPLLWQHLFWILGRSTVYVIVLSGIGVVSAIIPTFVRRRMVGYTWIVVAEMATALIGFGVWTHHM